MTGYAKVTTQKTGHCSVETTLSVIGGKWKPLILWHLGEGGVCRFLELQRLIPGITRKMLTQHLRELERDGVVARKIFNERPQHVEYSLTQHGTSLRPLLRALCEWGARHESQLSKNGIKQPVALRAVPRSQPQRMVPAIG